MSKIIVAIFGMLFALTALAVPRLGDTDPRNDDDSVSKIELDAYCMDLPTFAGFMEEWKEVPMMTGRTTARYKGNDIRGEFILFVHPKTFKYTSVIVFDDKWCITSIGTRLKPAKQNDNKR